MADEDREKGLLSRWARRKEAVREAEEKERASPAPEPSTAPGERKSEAETIAELPDIESLDEKSDFTLFMREGVPAELRRQALRKLWRINPIYNFRDGLAEYDLDYSALGKPMAGGVKTVYQVGRGMLRPEPKEAERAACDSVGKEDDTGAPKPEAPAEQAVTTAEEPERPPVAEAPSPSAPTAEPADDSGGAAGAAIGAPKARDRVTAEVPRRRAAERRWGRFTES